MLTQTTRATKAATIDRTINVTAEREPWGVTVYATVFEHQVGRRTIKNISDVYILSRIEADFGIGIRVEKHTGTGAVYHVNLSNGQLAYDECDCAWGSYGGNRKACRHVEACKQAIREGKL
jgi:hypothetical protein